MNKKTIIVAILVLAMAITAAVYLLTRPLPLSLEQLFPSQALMYGRLSNVKADFQQLVNTEFWKSVAGIDIPLVMEHNKALASDVHEVRRIKKELEDLLKNPLTEKFLGQEIAIALYDKNPGAPQKSEQSYEAVFATRLGLSLQMAELFVSMAKQWSDDITTSNEEYQGFHIVKVHFHKKKLDVSYVRIKDVLLASIPSSRALYHAIDVFHKKSPSLSTDQEFARAVTRAYPNGHGMFYVNVQKMSQLFKNHLPSQQRGGFDRISKQASGFRSYLLSFLPGEISKMKLIMNVDSQKMGPSWQNLFKCTASYNPSLKFVPYNVMVYQWGQCYDFKDIWQRISLSTRWGNILQKKLNISLEKELFPVLGSQLGGYLNDVDTQSLYPYPRGVAFIKIDKRSEAENLIKKFTEKPIAVIQQEEYQKVDIHYITLPFGANMDPGYAFLGDFLLLGSSRQLIKTSIDAFNNPNQSLESDAMLKQFNLDQPSQGMVFVKLEDFSKKMQNILDWYNKIVSSQIGMALTYQQEADSHKKELQEAIASKKQEIDLANNKLKVLIQDLSIPDLPEDIKQEKQSTLTHLKEQADVLKEELNSYAFQQRQLHDNLVAYQLQSEYSKIWLFNSDEVFMPLIKGLGSLHTAAMSLHMTEQVSETEILIQ